MMSCRRGDTTGCGAGWSDSNGRWCGMESVGGGAEVESIIFHFVSVTFLFGRARDYSVAVVAVAVALLSSEKRI